MRFVEVALFEHFSEMTNPRPWLRRRAVSLPAPEWWSSITETFPTPLSSNRSAPARTCRRAGIPEHRHDDERVIVTLPGARVTVFEVQEAKVHLAKVKQIGSSIQPGWGLALRGVPSLTGPVAATSAAAAPWIRGAFGRRCGPRRDIDESKWQIAAGFAYPLFG